MVRARAAAYVVGLAGLVGAVVAHAGVGSSTRITVWGTAFGGSSYGGFVQLTGGLITEQREVDIAASGEARLSGIAATIDPASVQLRDLTEPGVAITELRYVPGATTPTELLARRIGETITVLTTKGEVRGVLRSVDDQTLVVEVGAGEHSRLAVMRRDGYVLDVRVPGARSDRPSLGWRAATRKPGKHTVELSYRAGGITWIADYLAVLDDAGKALDFSAWATVTNATGAGFERAELTLVSGGTLASYAHGSVPRPPATSFSVPSPVRLAAGDSVRLELVPARTAARVRPIVVYEPAADEAANHQDEPSIDCSSGTLGGSGGRSTVALEVDVPAQVTLPDGPVRLFRRRGDRLEVVSEDVLRATAGVARIKLARDGDITGARRALSCNVDERAQTIEEKIEIRVENKGKQATEVVIRDFAWRWPVWKLDGEDRKSVRAGAQTLEYRVRVPAKGSQTVTYSIVYTW